MSAILQDPFLRGGFERAPLHHNNHNNTEEALLHAVRSGDAAEVARLLNAGVNPNRPSGASSGATPLIEASLAGNLAVARALLAHIENSGLVVNAATDYDWTALDAACNYGHTAIVKLLKAAGAMHFDRAARAAAGAAAATAAAAVEVGGDSTLHVIREKRC